MSIDGIWTTEVYGAFGWENRGVYLLENGRMIGGDNRQYSMGTYSVSGDQVTAELKVHYYGPPRTMFGEEREEYTIKLDGKLEDDAVEGTVYRLDKPQLELQYRWTRRMVLSAKLTKSTE